LTTRPDFVLFPCVKSFQKVLFCIFSGSTGSTSNTSEGEYQVCVRPEQKHDWSFAAVPAWPEVHMLHWVVLMGIKQVAVLCQRWRRSAVNLNLLYSA